MVVAAAAESQVEATGHPIVKDKTSAAAANDSLSATDIPPVLAVNNIGLRDGADSVNDAPPGAAAIADGSGNTTASGSHGDGGGSDNGRDGALGADRGVIAKLFRAVDTDGSGLISPEELVEGVRE